MNLNKQSLLLLLFARASRLFVHFFAVTARPRRESALNFTFYRGGTQATTKFPLSF